MNKQTYRFHETGAIPGIPGEFHAGLLVDVDLDTITVIEKRLMNEPVVSASEPAIAESVEEPTPEPSQDVPQQEDYTTQPLEPEPATNEQVEELPSEPQQEPVELSQEAEATPEPVQQEGDTAQPLAEPETTPEAQEQLPFPNEAVPTPPEQTEAPVETLQPQPQEGA